MRFIYCGNFEPTEQANSPYQVQLVTGRSMFSKKHEGEIVGWECDLTNAYYQTGNMYQYDFRFYVVFHTIENVKEFIKNSKVTILTFEVGIKSDILSSQGNPSYTRSMWKKGYFKNTKVDDSFYVDPENHHYIDLKVKPSICVEKKKFKEYGSVFELTFSKPKADAHFASSCRPHKAMAR